MLSALNTTEVIHDLQSLEPTAAKIFGVESWNLPGVTKTRHDPYTLQFTNPITLAILKQLYNSQTRGSIFAGTVAAEDFVVAVERKLPPMAGA